jgi:hypothetical protein
VVRRILAVAALFAVHRYRLRPDPPAARPSETPTRGRGVLQRSQVRELSFAAERGNPPTSTHAGATAAGADNE